MGMTWQEFIYYNQKRNKKLDLCLVCVHFNKEATIINASKPIGWCNNIQNNVNLKKIEIDDFNLDRACKDFKLLCNNVADMAVHPLLYNQDFLSCFYCQHSIEPRFKQFRNNRRSAIFCYNKLSQLHIDLSCYAPDYTPGEDFKGEIYPEFSPRQCKDFDPMGADHEITDLMEKNRKAINDFRSVAMKEVNCNRCGRNLFHDRCQDESCRFRYKCMELSMRYRRIIYYESLKISPPVAINRPVKRRIILGG